MICTPLAGPASREPHRLGHRRGVGHLARSVTRPATGPFGGSYHGYHVCPLGELAKWTALRGWGPRRLADVASWRQHIAVLSYDETVTTMWGQLQARAQLRGRPRPVNDTWIAACCLVDGLPLATLNVKDFVDFAEYESLILI
jgi:toxin FitB